MMKKLRDCFSPNNREKGSSEIVVTLFSIPLLCFMLFSLINVSTYFQVRSAVQDAAQDGSRLVALYGGSTTSAFRNNTGKNVSTTIQNRIYQSGKCTLSYCSAAPVVDCFVLVNGVKSARATEAGQPAVCTIDYQFSPVAPVWGFGGLFQAPLKIEAVTVTETGYR